MFTLSAKADPKEYADHMDEECKFGKFKVTVGKDTIHSKSGSYGKGLKFHVREVGYLTRMDRSCKLYSFDHGVTWNFDKLTARKLAGRKKVTLSRKTNKEFAYDAIQVINKKYGI